MFHSGEEPHNRGVTTEEHNDDEGAKLNAPPDGQLYGSGSTEEGAADLVLEQMLSKAQRLASEMKEQSAASASGSLTGGDDRFDASLCVPATIEMKDSVTECSSVGLGMPLTDHGTKKGCGNIKEQIYITEKNVNGSVSSRGNTSAKEEAPDYKNEKKSCDDPVDAAVCAAQEMQRQMEVALKTLSRNADSIDMPRSDGPSPKPPLSPEILAKSLDEGDQGVIPSTKCFMKSKEEDLGNSEVTDISDQVAPTGCARQVKEREPRKSRSSSSSSSVSEDDIIAAINAANEMQQQLEEVLRISFRNVDSTDVGLEKSANPLPTSRAPVSPIPVQPPDLNEKGVPLMEPSSRKVEPGGRVGDRLPVSQTEKKFCEYDVAVADYSKSRRPPSSERQSDDVKWEKVASAGEGDDDFVPIRDYSKTMHTNMQEIVEPISSQLTYSQHRAIIRSRRRKKRRKMAAILLAAAFAMCLLLMHYYLPYDDQAEVADEQAEDEASASEAISPATVPITDEISTGTVSVDAKPNVFLDTEITSQVVETQPVLMQERKQICDFPFASLLSPICRGEQPMEFHVRAQARREKVEQLVDSMMQ